MGVTCKNCGITKESAYITYDGYVSPYIQKKCEKEREKCEDSFCMTCNLDGGHIVEFYGTGRHKWRRDSDE